MRRPGTFIPGYGHAFTAREKAQWEARQVAEITTTFHQGIACLKAGEREEGLFWLERAERLAGQDDNIAFTRIMAQLEGGDIRQALPRLQALWATHDAREVGLALAGALLRCGERLAGAHVMDKVLARNSIAPAHYGLADALSLPAGRPGWASLSNKGAVRVRIAGQAELELDGQSLGPVPAGLHDMAALMPIAGPRWWEGEHLVITCAGQPVLGSPIDIQAVIRCQSLLMAEADGVRGWLWYPGEPEFLPSISVGEQAPPLLVDGPATGFSSKALLQRPYGFYLPYADWPRLEAGVTGFYDHYGRPLRGAPLDPALIRLMRTSPQPISKLKGWTRQGYRKPCRAAPTLRGGTTAHQGRAVRDGLSDSAPDSQDNKQTVRLVNGQPDKQQGSRKGAGHDEGTSFMSGCAIIMPLWRDEAMARASLSSVLSTIPAECRLILVDDAIIETELREYLRGLAQVHSGQVTLVRHEENSGFVASINTGLGYVPEGWDVILLNSDTVVFGNWVERLCGWLRRAGVGTVTPLSNAGGLTSYPSANRDNPAPELEDGAMLDRLCQTLSSTWEGPAISLPTANGFCMAVSAAALAALGPLRRAFFAQGYGEENDFCLRASEAGFTHLAATDVYVLHYGHGSFGQGGIPLLERNLEILNRLYPGYDEAIKRWQQADMLGPFRRMMDWQRLARLRDGCREAVLLLQHRGGGGVARAVREQAERLGGEGMMPLILEPTATGCRLLSPVLDLPVPNLVFTLPDEYPLLLEFLQEMGVSRVVWHHLMGHEAGMRRLHHHLGVPYDIHVHDHVWFCPRITLLGPENRYCGEPDIGGCMACLARGDVAMGEDMPLSDYLARSRDELSQARRVVAPSRDAAHRLARHLPDCCSIEVEPLEDDTQIWAGSSPRAVGITPTRAQPVRILVLGGISRWKGYDILLALGRHIQQEGLPLRLVLIGSTHDDGALLRAGIEVTGPYRDDDLPRLMDQAKADIGFVPSIAPESWCYTLGWLWKAGLAVYGFDIGTSAERIRQAGPHWGQVLPLGLPIMRLAAFFMQI